MIKAIIFDFDGLIVDTEHPQYQSWQEIFSQSGLKLPLSDWAVVLGTDELFDPTSILLTASERYPDTETIRARYQARCDELTRQEKLMPGVEMIIQQALELGLRLGIASSSGRDWVLGFLNRFGLTAKFSVILSRENVQNVKPAPDLYFGALEQLQVDASEALVFEDSPNGVKAGQAAGIFTIAVPNRLTSQLDLSFANLILPTLAGVNLVALIETIHPNGSSPVRKTND